jgi:hypothetical protein
MFKSRKVYCAFLLFLAAFQKASRIEVTQSNTEVPQKDTEKNSVVKNIF